MSRIATSAEWNSIDVFSVAAVAVAIAADVAVVVNDDGDGAYDGPMDKEQLSKGCC